MIGPQILRFLYFRSDGTYFFQKTDSRIYIPKKFIAIVSPDKFMLIRFKIVICKTEYNNPEKYY